MEVETRGRETGSKPVCPRESRRRREGLGMGYQSVRAIVVIRGNDDGIG